MFTTRRPLPPPDPRPGSTHTGSTHTGSTHTGSTHTGSTRTGTPHTGTPHTGMPHAGTGGGGTGSAVDRSSYTLIRERVHGRLLSELNPAAGRVNDAEVRRALERIYAEVLVEMSLPISRSERAEYLSLLIADILGFGPLEALLQDDTVTEVLVNGPNQVYVERAGVLELSDTRFRDNEDLMRIIERIVAPLGRRVDESSPMVDARLADGSRVNIIIPPLSLVGPCMSIRKFAKAIFDPNDLVRLGAVTPEIVAFLRACVRARLNLVVSGGTSSGKTTILNILSTFIPDTERILTIEDAAELQLQQQHVVRLEARPSNMEGRGAIPIRQLVMNALRMRPDRIVVGEARGGEALDMLQAMNTGHDGSMTTIHSNGARDTLARVETMVLMAGMELPLRAIREQISAAFDVIVHLERLADGTRKIVQVSEVQNMEGELIVMQDIFRYVQTGMVDGRVQGYFTAMGIRPKFMAKIDAKGSSIPPNTFVPAQEMSRRPR